MLPMMGSTLHRSQYCYQVPGVLTMGSTRGLAALEGQPAVLPNLMVEPILTVASILVAPTRQSLHRPQMRW